MKFIIFILALTSLSCVTNPHTKRVQLNFMPDSQMNALGLKSYRDIKSKEQIITSGPLYDQIKKVGQRIAKASHVPFKWEFALIKKDKMINAFCLPGGKIAIYTGILPVALNEAGLAAIMGHEVAHAVLKHGAERMSQALLLNAGLTAAQVTLQNQEHKGTILAALGLGGQFGVLMPFSRHHESEADLLGLRYMARAGYDVREAPKLWRRMAQKGGSGPEILSTHPDPIKRSRILEKEVAKVWAEYQRSPKHSSQKLLF